MFQKKTFYLLWFSLILILYTFSLLSPFIINNFHSSFNYLDESSYWQAIDSFLQGKIIYKDFLWDYGLLYIVLAVPFYLFINKSLFSIIFIRIFFIPILVLLLSYLTSKKLFASKINLLLIMTLLFIFNVNRGFGSLRSILPESSIIFTYLGLKNKNKKDYFIGSFLLSLSFLGSLEYALIGILSFFILFLYYVKTYPFNFKTFLLQIITLFTLPAIYLIYLAKNEALIPLFYFYKQISASFLENPPCRAVYPRAYELKSIFQNQSNFLLSFNNTIQMFNLYILLIIAVILVFIVLKKGQKLTLSLIIPLFVYYIISYARIIITPCTSRIGYNLFSLFIILLIVNQKKLISKNIFSAFLIWLFISFNYLYIINPFLNLASIFSQKKNTKYYSIAGINLSKNEIASYQEIIDYINTYSLKNDYVLDYPNGHFHLITNRKSPLTAPSVCYYQRCPYFEMLSYQQLLKSPPAYVIININNGIFCKSGQNFKNKFHSINQKFFIEGIKSPIETYLENNYQIVFKNNKAWILQKNDKVDKLPSVYLPLNIDFEIKPHSQNNLIQSKNKPNEFPFNLNQSVTINPFNDKHIRLVKIELKLKSINRYFDKYILGIIFQTNQRYLNSDGGGLVLTSKWQTLWTEIPYEKFIQNEYLKSIILISTQNRGFLPFEKNKILSINSVKFYKLNPELKFEDTEIEKL